MIKNMLFWLQLQMQRLHEQGIRLRLNLLVQKVIRILVQLLDGFLSRHPKMRFKVLKFMDVLGLKAYLLSFRQTTQLASDPVMLPLSSRENQVLRELKKAIVARKSA